MLGQVDAERFKHDRPVNGVRWHENIFTDHMIIGWPLLVELVGSVSGGGDIICQGIEPYVGDKVLVKGQFDAPF